MNGKAISGARPHANPANGATLAQSLRGFAHFFGASTSDALVLRELLCGLLLDARADAAFSALQAAHTHAAHIAMVADLSSQRLGGHGVYRNPIEWVLSQAQVDNIVGGAEELGQALARIEVLEGAAWCVGAFRSVATGALLVRELLVIDDSEEQFDTLHAAGALAARLGMAAN